MEAVYCSTMALAAVVRRAADINSRDVTVTPTALSHMPRLGRTRKLPRASPSTSSAKMARTPASVKEFHSTSLVNMPVKLHDNPAAKVRSAAAPFGFGCLASFIFRSAWKSCGVPP